MTILAMSSTTPLIHLWIPGKHPRKELVSAMHKRGFCGPSPKVSRIFRDKADGRTVQTGYIVAGHWVEFYAPVEKERT